MQFTHKLTDFQINCFFIFVLLDVTAGDKASIYRKPQSESQLSDTGGHMQSVNDSLLKVIKVPHLNAVCIYTFSVRLSNAVFFCVGTIETVRRTACAKIVFLCITLATEVWPVHFQQSTF